MKKVIALVGLLLLAPAIALGAGTSVGVSGSWKAISTISVGVSGAWKVVSKGWVGVSGSWKVFYTAGFVFNDTLSGDAQDYNVSTHATSAGWNGTDVLFATINTNGHVIGSSSASTAAFIVPSLPATSTVNVTNTGYIVGHGGDGGGLTAGDGGTALSIAYATTINNLGGVIGGGGGGGGRGGPGGPTGGGGGGAGNGVGAGGIASNLGSDGTLTMGGAGASGGPDVGLGTGGDGGDGGNLGTAGSGGGAGDGGAGSSGGAAGACKTGAGTLNFTNMGTTAGTGC